MLAIGKIKITDNLCIKFHCTSSQSRRTTEDLTILGKYLIFAISEYFFVMELALVLASIPCPFNCCIQKYHNLFSQYVLSDIHPFNA